MITVLDYGIGNIGSVLNMVKKAGGVAVKGSTQNHVEAAEKLIITGVGTFDAGMSALHERNLVETVKKAIVDRKIPVLGICLGMQLLCKSSDEGVIPGLGVVNASVKKFSMDSYLNLKVPHMGWNTVAVRKTNLLIEKLDSEQRFYFVHSYFVECNDPDDILLSTKYGQEFTSAFCHGSTYGVQFHPEKSHRFGLELMKNFLRI